MEPIRSLNDFLQRDSEEQKKFATEEYQKEFQSNNSLLNGDEWPRVEELELEDNENETVELQGIISPGSKELQMLSDFVSNISSCLRLDSQNEGIALVSSHSIDQSQTLMADNAIKESDVFLTAVPQQSSPRKMDFAQIYNSQIVEAAIFPGIDADFTKLPNDVRVENMIQKGIKKIHDSGIYGKKMSKRWIRLLCSSCSCQIVSASFWYLWHHQFSPENENQTKLLERISRVFVGVFINSSLSSHSKDEIFKIYPNIMSIAVWYGFMDCFPKSHKHFGIPFQTIICDSLAEWMLGIIPFNPWCLEWESSEATRGEPLPGSTTANTQNPGILRLNYALELRIFASKNYKGDNNEKKQRDSCKIGPSHKIIKNRFDVYQNSPIISKYLTVAGYHKSHGSLIVHRSHVIRETSNPSIPTYRQIVDESIKNTSLHYQDYKDKIKRASKEKLSIIQEANQYLTREESIQKKILNNANLIKEKAHSLLQEMAQTAKIKKEKILAKRKQGKIII